MILPTRCSWYSSALNTKLERFRTYIREHVYKCLAEECTTIILLETTGRTMFVVFNLLAESPIVHISTYAFEKLRHGDDVANSSHGSDILEVWA